MPTAATWLAASRPKTLPAALSPVLIGTAMAFADDGLHVLSAILCAVSAACIQIATNFHNDVADYEKGSDTPNRKGPVRVTAAGLVSPSTMKRATVGAFGMAILAGGYLMVRGGWPIVVIGIFSILFGILYTGGRRSLASLGLADLFVFVFFGPVAVAGTYYVQTLTINAPVIIAGLAPGALSVAILLVNNTRDVGEDALSGKRTLIVRLGRQWGARLYGLCLGVASAVPIVLALSHPASSTVLVALLALPAGVYVLHRMRSETDGARFNQFLARTAQVLLLYSILFSIGWAV
ncbi:MAG: 1,4-dihydroxy-2-naphthoate polyprenyltransferase [Rhodothermia bacterium]|nr:1,4-dihydroxy-2-naphthoate polyprenyltransferase [Rhodothermia bacterium]